MYSFCLQQMCMFSLTVISLECLLQDGVHVRLLHTWTDNRSARAFENSEATSPETFLGPYLYSNEIKGNKKEYENNDDDMK